MVSRGFPRGRGREIIRGVDTVNSGIISIVVPRYGAGPERTTSKTKGTATSPHRGPALVGSQYFDLWHLKNVKTKFRKKI